MTRLQHCFLYALAIVCAQVAFATPYLNLGLLGAPTWLQLLSALVSCGLFLSGAYWVVRTINSISFSPWRFLTSLSKRDWIILIVIVGCILRVVWDAIFPSLPTSDAATYVDLGQKLSRGETYFIGGTYAYWPPGYPFLLGVLYYFVGYSEAAMLALNIFIYGVTIWVVYGLAEHVLDDYSARVATVLLTIWPNHFMAANGATKEYFLIPVLVGAVWLYLIAANSTRWKRIIPLVAGGMALGYGALIQPGSMLFISAIIIYALTCKTLRARLAIDLVLLLVGMAVVISPWIARNYSVFGKIVMTTGGGSVLYRANNPLATGGYTKRGVVSLQEMSELEANRKGSDLAIEWISENPAQFLKLALIKQIRFLGDDSIGAYGSKRSMQKNWQYPLFKGISNLFWIVVWGGVFLSTILALRRSRGCKPELILVALCFLYFYGIHSVFESDGKYHFPALGFIAILASSFVYQLYRPARIPD
jgi:4-amino-4-deoxy-L-arabinose transferase-like glycosyltransferase